MITKECHFPRNIDISGLMDKKLLFQNNLQQRALPRNVDIYGEVHKTRLFSKLSLETSFPSIY